MLPEDQAVELRSLFDEFEACQTPEAKFVRAMDNLQPILLNDANNGRDWRLHQVKASQVQKRQERTALGSAQIWEFINGLIDENRRKGNLRDE
jgi:putative hydrolase of HD superfamily